MKNITMAQLVEEAKNLGCSLVPGPKIKLIAYDADGFEEIKLFKSKDDDCESKIRHELKKVKDRLIGDFYEMSGSLHLLGLSMSDSQGRVFIYKDDPCDRVAEFPCDPTGLRQMTNWVADALIEHCEDTQDEPDHRMTPPERASKAPIHKALPNKQYVPKEEDAPINAKESPKPEEQATPAAEETAEEEPTITLLPANVVISIRGLQELNLMNLNRAAGVCIGLFEAQALNLKEVAKFFADSLESAENDGEK